MNTQILNKCIEELKKDNPDLSYIRGILETLVDSNPVMVTSQWQPQGTTPVTTLTSTANNQIELSDEEREQLEFMRRYNTGPVAELQ